MMGRIFKEFNSMCANMATHVKNLVENTASLALNKPIACAEYFIELKLYVLDKTAIASCRSAKRMRK